LVGDDLPSLSGVFFDLTYDASLLSYQGADFDNRLDFVIDRDAPAGASGAVREPHHEAAEWRAWQRWAPPTIR
ncbi:hypothetical protein, partial [Roseovarius sp. D22-M7]|uniref:hypothetical protein n=1 Tax=Roseovarius sp. D22-M7 TaxID=3127116 RepID=UPI0030102BE5